jgi:folate-dependent phosphoribosylglycinamide formyltransferase PurN
MDEIYEDGKYNKGDIILIQEDVPYEGSFTYTVVIAKEDFEYREKWDDWIVETGKKRQSPKIYFRFYQWLLEKEFIEKVNYRIITI